MPYIITTTRPCGAQFNRCREPGHERVSRRAVATLEEAREAARDVIIDGPARYGCDPHVIATYSLREPGGTIGPLPDGTVIEVERVSPYALLQRIPDAAMRPKRRAYIGNPAYGPGHYLAEIIDAYNASAVAA